MKLHKLSSLHSAACAQALPKDLPGRRDAQGLAQVWRDELRCQPGVNLEQCQSSAIHAVTDVLSCAAATGKGRHGAGQFGGTTRPCSP